MSDLSTIRIPVDSSPVNEAVAKLRSLELKFRNLVRQSEVGSAQYKRGLLEIKRAYQELGVSSQRASAEIDRYSKAVLNAAAQDKAAKQAKREAMEAQKAANLEAKEAARLLREQEKAQREQERVQKAANAELARQEAAYEQVKQAIDPLYAAQQRYNQQLETIRRKHGETSASAEALNADIAALQATFARAGIPVDQFGNVTGVAGTRANTFGMVLQQTGYQVGDFAVQVQSGTNVFVAFGQQATQLAGLLYLVPGAIGVIAGTIASIGIPAITGLLAYFSRTGEQAKDVTTSIDDLSSSVSEYAASVEAALAPTEELMGQYGRLPGMAQRARDVLDQIADANRIAALEALRESVASLAEQFGSFDNTSLGEAMGSELETTLYNIRSQLDLSRESAYQVALALEQVNSADTIGELSQALVEANAALTEAGVAANSELAAGLLKAAEEAIRINGLMEQANGTIDATGIAIVDAAIQMVNLANNMGTAQASANSLLTSMQGVAVAAYNAAMAMALAEEQRSNNRIMTQYGLYQRTRELAPEFPTLPEFNGPRPPGRPFELGVPDLPSDSAGDSGGGDQIQVEEDRLALLQERVAKETELLSLTDAQRQVVETLGDQYSNYSAEQIAQVEQQIEAYNRLVEAQKKQEEIMNTVESAMTSAFMSMIDGSKSAEEAFADMARSIIAKLYEVLVVQQLVNAATGFLGGGISGLTGAPTIGNFGGGRASGGSIMSGRAYMVGEQGPELIVPRHSGTVLNAANTNSAKGGDTVVVNNNISVTGSDAAMVRNEVTKLIPQITEASKAAVINARQRGGQMRATFGG
ncbi:hypothetical protein UFOVP346_45 [uncultured Caudovirales phage]|uniref:Bacteriophage lambda, GpH, tail tape measure, C-terminal n=1 Tax=uncultured Caudovirales phage TaxID=2100421 RepID=A0A6J5M6F6_9CAUD|nr:hypothetical protein UFOVP346_45 [uncultured Caudovirales phage]